MILLTVGYLVHHQREYEKPRYLVETLCPEQSTSDVARWRKVWLAGEVTLELGTNRVRDTDHGRRSLARTRRQLTAFLEQGALTPREHSEAGDVLSQLGDPRFDPDSFFLPSHYRGEPEPLAGFVEIPPGPFVMGNRKGNQDARDNEFGNPKTLEIKYPFWMVRYAVTVDQFRLFVETKDYEEQSWWTQTGWEWRLGKWDSQVEGEFLRDWLKNRSVKLRNKPMWWDEQQDQKTYPSTNLRLVYEAIQSHYI